MHLTTVRAKLNEMRQLEASLASFVESCDEACCKGPTRDCSIIEDLSAVKPHTPASREGGCSVTPPAQGKQAAPVDSAAFRQVRRT
jgi:hypothetical protein